MSVIKDVIYALKGIAIPSVLILVGALSVRGGAPTLSNVLSLIGPAIFFIGIFWVAYLSFLARD